MPTGGQQFFGTPLVDRINKISPGHCTQAGGNTVHDSVSTADFVNQWTIYNSVFDGGANVNTVSLGAFTTAPDGTNTGQHITEATNNGLHSLMCGSFPAGNAGNIKGFPWYRERLAVIAKAAERTRIVLQAGQNNGTTGIGVGIQACYDLANGAVAVAPAHFGSGDNPFSSDLVWQAIAGNITSLGSNWYLCTMDFVPGTKISAGGAFVCSMLLDNGSGNAAISDSYAGNGASGVYVWRSSLLPVQCYGMTKQSFFDDFTSLSTIDLTNSRNPKFNWFLNTAFPNFNANLAPTDPSTLSITGGTILSMTTAATPLALTISSVTYLGDFPFSGVAPYVGKAFGLPFLSETKFSWNYNSSDYRATGSFWSRELEGLMTPNALGTDTAAENDWYEDIPGGHVNGADPRITLSCPTPFSGSGDEPVLSTLIPPDSYPLWSSGEGYGVGFQVAFNGVFYQCTNNNGVGFGGPQQPDISPGFWSVITPTPTYIVDYTALNILSALMLPYLGPDDQGQVVTFWNGILVSGMCFGPVMPIGPGAITPTRGSVYYNEVNNKHWPLLWGTGSRGVNVDWVSVYQNPDAALGNLTIQDSSAASISMRALDLSNVGTGPFDGGREIHDGVAGVLTAGVNAPNTLLIDGSALRQNVVVSTSGTGTQSSVASSASAVILLLGNVNRLAATIYNESTQILYLLLGVNETSPVTVSTTHYTIQVQPNTRYEVPANFIGIIQGVWAMANGFARITEFT